MLIRILMAATMMPTAAPLRDAQDLIPLELLAQGPELSTVKVAPDKRQLAVVAMRDGRRSIMLDDMDGGNRRLLYRNPLRSIGDVHWSGDGRWLYTFQDAGGDEGYHLFRIDLQRPGSATDLTPFAGSRVEAIRTPSPPPRVVPITLDRRDREWPDAYSLDLATGKLTEQVRNTIGATEFFADEKGLVRAATAIRIDGRLELLRKNPAGRWSVLYIAPIFERFSVVTLAPGGRSVIVRTNRDRAAEQLLEIELATGRQKPVLDGTCGRFDVGGIQYRSDGKVAAITCVLERADLKGGDPFFRRVIN